MHHLKATCGKTIHLLEQKGSQFLQSCAKIVRPSLEDQLNKENQQSTKTPPNQTMFRSVSSEKTSVRRPPNQPTMKSSSETSKENLVKTSNNSSSKNNLLASDKTSNCTYDRIEGENQEQKSPDQIEYKKRNSDVESMLSFSTGSDLDIPPLPPCPPLAECPLESCRCGKPKPKPSSRSIIEKGINTDGPHPGLRTRPVLKNKKCQVHCICRSRRLCEEKLNIPVRKLYVRSTKRGSSRNRTPLTRCCVNRKNNGNDINLLTRLYNTFKQNIRNSFAFMDYLRSKRIVHVKCNHKGRRLPKQKIR